MTAELLAELEALVPLAPLHEPHNLAPIRMAMTLNPELPQVACFERPSTAPRPRSSRPSRYPSALRGGRAALRFHGLSYEYIASVLPERAPEIADGRVIVAHLGNGCSACALKARTSVATTMGFTALDGLPMGTRCGALDAGAVLHLIQQKGMSADALVDLLYRRSGMLGLSGISSDFRKLLASEEPRARFALEVFYYRTARQIGSLAASLGGLDGIVFTAGIGENARRSAAPSAGPAAGWGLNSTREPTGSTGHASARRRVASPPMSSRPTRT